MRRKKCWLNGKFEEGFRLRGQRLISGSTGLTEVLGLRLLDSDSGMGMFYPDGSDGHRSIRDVQLFVN